jgi:hypothetical protein
MRRSTRLEPDMNNPPTAPSSFVPPPPARFVRRIGPHTLVLEPKGPCTDSESRSEEIFVMDDVVIPDKPSPPSLV